MRRIGSLINEKDLAITDERGNSKTTLTGIRGESVPLLKSMK